MLKAEQLTTLERKIDRFAKILREKPGDELTVLALAEASFRRGLKLEALTAYQEVIGVLPVPEVHLAVSEIYAAQDMPNEAYGELRRLFALDPENVEARLLVKRLKSLSKPPQDIREIMDTLVPERAIEEAQLRLKIQRTIHNRELQERTRNITLEPGKVIHEYYVEEAKKKLIEVDSLLRDLEKLREDNTAAEVPRAEPLQAVAMTSDEASTETLVMEEASLETDSSDSLATDEIAVEIAFENPEEMPVQLADSDLGEVEVPIVPESEVAESFIEEPSLVSGPVEPETTFLLDVPNPGDDPIESASEPVEDNPLIEQAEASVETYETFDLTPESPVIPDLPEEPEPVAPSTVDHLEAPSMVDLEPIELTASGPSIEVVVPDTMTIGEGGPILEQHETVEPAVEEETVLQEAMPVDTSSAAMDTADVVELDAAEVLPEAGTHSAARQAFYDSQTEAVSGLTSTLARTRGVTSIFLVSKEGVTINSVVKDDISEVRVGEVVKESFEFLEAFASDPSYWVLECAGGIFVMQKLDDRHVLIAIGQAGANFGALRYTMDKTRAKFEVLLKDAPA